MDAALPAALLLVCGALVVRHMLRSLGVGAPAGKPDCGCGHCADRKRERTNRK